MKLNTQSPLVLLCLFFSITFFFSCSKDSDLLADYVALDPEVLIGKYVRSDTFQISIISNSEDDTFEITVNSGNGDTENSESGGTIVNDTYQTSSSASIVLDVLANDTFKNIENVSISETSQPSNGSIVINSDNTLTYTPYTIQPTEDQFTYTTEFINEDGTVGTETGNVSVSVISPADRNYGALKAFPTAYGAGSNATGGRGGAVYLVTNLNDSGSGSFRAAVEASGKRTVVFRVSGTIELTNSLSIYNGDLTIAGQSAPEGGITLTGSRVYFQDADNIILRYIRFRPTWNQSQWDIEDALTFTRCTDVIVDHCSVSFGLDESITFVGSSGGVSGSDNITLQRSLVADGAKGVMFGYTNYQDVNPHGTPMGDFSCNQNLFVDISHRFPTIVTNQRGDVINNVVHNWRYKLVVMNAPSNVDLNLINNYYQRGAQSNVISGAKVSHIDYDASYKPFVHAKGNIISDEFTNPNADNKPLFVWWGKASPTGTYLGTVEDSNYYTENPFPQLVNAFVPLTAVAAFDDVNNNVGANAVVNGSGNVVFGLDILDSRYINNTKTNAKTAHGYYDDRSQTPHYVAFRSTVSSTPINSHAENYDLDKDGMPDVWEAAVFGDLTKTADGDEDGNGYTNLEEYLDLVDF